VSFFGLLGVTGLHARQATKSGWLGLAGYLLFSLWLVLIMGFSFVEAFILPRLANSTPTFVQAWMGMFTGPKGTFDLGILPTIWTLTAPSTFSAACCSASQRGKRGHASPNRAPGHSCGRDVTRTPLSTRSPSRGGSVHVDRRVRGGFGLGQGERGDACDDQGDYAGYREPPPGSDRGTRGGREGPG
jgi:hypothetical protein